MAMPDFKRAGHQLGRTQLSKAQAGGTKLDRAHVDRTLRQSAGR